MLTCVIPNPMAARSYVFFDRGRVTYELPPPKKLQKWAVMGGHS